MRQTEGRASAQSGSGGSTGGSFPLLLALLGVILALRILMLRVAATDLFFDEAQYWSWSEAPAFGYYSKPPLIAWLIGLSTGVCGLSEFCIRLPSPLIHSGTALLVFWLGRRLYDDKVGFWSALVFATLPGVSLSSGIISTDVPLLFCWALALVALVEIIKTKSWWPALLLGLALGLGLNAKYAMAFFLLGLGVYLAATPSARWLLKDLRLYLALALGAAMILPNVYWNWQHSFATLSHTADNAKWGGALLHPINALEFFGAQFGVFGPILFAVLLLIVWRAWKEGLPVPDRFLLSFSLPILLLITLQAFLSRAHANWAATTYVAATVLVTATLLRRFNRRALNASLGLHVAAAVLMGIGIWQAGSFALPGGADPFARTLGWKGVADETRKVIEIARKAGRPFGAVVTDDRSLTAELLYYMRSDPTPVRAWRPSGQRPRDHFELTRPYKGAVPDPLLLISRTKRAELITAQFAKVEEIGKIRVPAGKGKPHKLTFYRLSGWNKPAAQ